MSHRMLWVAGVLALGSCGGLAADGREPSDEAAGADCTREECPGGIADDGALDAERRPAPERGTGAARRSGGVEPEPGPGAPEAVASVPGVGDACGPSSSQDERITIGEIALEASGNCGAGHLCLMWAAAAPPCVGSTDDPGCRALGSALDRDDVFVPVPAALAPELPARDRLCTCRCGGGGDGDYCSCPQGMACRELIPSSGANGAAADFVGSYCLY